MKTAARVSVLLCVIFCAEALAGIGEPLAGNSLNPAERGALLREVSKHPLVEAAGRKIGEEEVALVIERLPDRELKLLAQNSSKTMSGGTTFAELIVQLVILAAVLGFLLLLLLALGVVALFAGGAAASGSGGAPVGKAQYDAQRKKVEETKKIAKPDGQKQ